MRYTENIRSKGWREGKRKKKTIEKECASRSTVRRVHYFVRRRTREQEEIKERKKLEAKRKRSRIDIFLVAVYSFGEIHTQ